MLPYRDIEKPSQKLYLQENLEIYLLQSYKERKEIQGLEARKKVICSMYY